MNFQNINTGDYNYKLPESRIAQYPLDQRDQSKLLVCQNGKISKDVFSSIGNYLTDESLMVFNDTRVIHARLLFKKETGSEIEIFCLEPVLPSADYQFVFSAKSGVVWRCLAGNNKKWKQGKLILKNKKINLSAEKLEQTNDTFLIKFEWEPPEKTFASVIEFFGKIPLPPYIKRNANEKDNLRYQTLYAHYEGSVAAPTAGLHFTDEVFRKLEKKNIKTSFITLHVGAGTFKPVTSENIFDHSMHTEMFSVEKKLIEQILQNKNRIIAVGTTTVRTLESLYWAGVKLLEKKEDAFNIDQWEPYESKHFNVSFKEAFHALIDYCEKSNMDHINGNTRLMIVPGYKYKIVNEMITNFHQPKSTLLLLVSAFIGDAWKDAYQYALENNFRFLSYGDVCYFTPQPA
ncbi:MAG: S-adenosylmethionine:tRNA ribosyltransferase-isomerase [Bacteroidota bacterium]